MLDSINLEIEQLAQKNNGSYIEAIVEFQELKNIIDIEDIVEMLHFNIREKLKNEFIKKKYFSEKRIENSLPQFAFEE